MKDNMKNFREASEVVLKNIYVTNELKRKTLEKCTQRKGLIVKPRLIATFSAALVVFIGIFISFFHKPPINNNHIAKNINQEQENSVQNKNKVQEVPKLADSSSQDKSPSAALESKSNTKVNIPEQKKGNTEIAMMESKNISQDKDVQIVNQKEKPDLQNREDSNESFNNVPQNGVSASNSDSSGNKEINLEDQMRVSLALGNDQLTVEEAEKYFQSNILLPSYIPEGFKLTNISISKDEEKSVKLEYSSGSADFEILQSKNLSKLSGTRNISVGNNGAYSYSVKDEKTNNVTTKIIWILDNVQYSLTSNLPEDFLIKIAESINK